MRLRKYQIAYTVGGTRHPDPVDRRYWTRAAATRAALAAAHATRRNFPTLAPRIRWVVEVVTR